MKADTKGCNPDIGLERNKLEKGLDSLEWTLYWDNLQLILFGWACRKSSGTGLKVAGFES